MDDGQVYQELTAIFREVFADEAIVLRPETTAVDIPGWDSGRMIELIIAAEERFKVRFTSREVDRFERVGDFARTIREKSAA